MHGPNFTTILPVPFDRRGSSTLIPMCFTSKVAIFDMAWIEPVQRQKILATRAESRDSTSVGIGFGGPIEAFAFLWRGISGVHGVLEIGCYRVDAPNLYSTVVEKDLPESV